MYTFAEKQKAAQQRLSAKSTMPGREYPRQRGDVNSILQLQSTIRNQAVQRLLKDNVEELNAPLAITASTRFSHDFNRIPLPLKARAEIQPKLKVGTPGDMYEQEADRVAEQVMRMPEPKLQRACACGGGCPKCRAEQGSHEQLQTRRVHEGQALGQTEATVDAVSGGRPLTNEQRAFFEPRFGEDFSRVQVHTDGSADTAARAVGALAFTRGSDIVFRGDQYRPHTQRGRALIAHELTHVIQQHNQVHTLMRACNCSTVPDAAIPSAGWDEWMDAEFPTMNPGDWCQLQLGANNWLVNYNCFGWVLGEPRNINAHEIVSTIQSALRELGRDEEASRLSGVDVTVSYMDLFFWQKRRLRRCTSRSNALIVLFGSGENSPTHAALAAPTPCGNARFTSKLGGRGPLVIHDLNQLVGSQYGDIVRYYC